MLENRILISNFRFPELISISPAYRQAGNQLISSRFILPVYLPRCRLGRVLRRIELFEHLVRYQL